MVGSGKCDSPGKLAAIFVAEMQAGKFTEPAKLFFFSAEGGPLLVGNAAGACKCTFLISQHVNLLYRQGSISQKLCT